MRESFGFLSAGIFLVALSFAIAATLGGQGQGLCIGDHGFCANNEHMRWYMAIAAISGMLALLLTMRSEAGPLAGAVTTLLGLVAILAVNGGVGVTTGSADADSDASLQARLIRTVKQAKRISLEPDLSFPPEGEDGLVQLANGGLAARRFKVTRAARLRIDVEIDTHGDPTVELFLETNDGRERKLIDNDDDDGDGRNAKIETDVEIGDYLLVIRNVKSAGSLATGLSFKLKIAEAKIEDLVAPDRTLALVLGAQADDCAADISSCRIREGEVALGGRANRDDYYLLGIETGGKDACLHVSASPREGEPKLVLATRGVDEKLDGITAAANKGETVRIDKAVAANTTHLMLLVGGFETGDKYRVKIDLSEPDGSPVDGADACLPTPAAELRDAQGD